MSDVTEWGMSRSGAGAIYETLRDRVCLHEYPPLTVLREGALAKEFGVSRTPVREALQLLASLGVVEVRNGVGSVVTALGREEAFDIYEMRMKVAEMIGELSPRPVGAAEIAEIHDLAKRAEVLARQPSQRGYFEINHGAHFLIGRVIGNAALRESWHRLYFQSQRVWCMVVAQRGGEVADELARELRDVEAAMRENDAMAVGRIQRDYIAFAMRRLRDEEEDWFQVRP